MNTKTPQLCRRFVSRPGLFLSSLLTVVALLSPSAVRATDGVWGTAATGGLWSNTANWSGGLVADGSGASADFSTLNLTANNTVLFDAPHTLGSLRFGDTTTAFFNWTLSNNGNPANILTLLAASGVTPSITITNGYCTNNLVIAGTNGFSVNGSAAISGLALGAANTFTGDLTVNAGSGAAANWLSVFAYNVGALGGSATATNSVVLVGSATTRAMLYLNVSGASYPVYNSLILRPTGTANVSRAELHSAVGSATWNGNILLDGVSTSVNPRCDIYCDVASSTLTINGNITTTNNFVGQMTFRGLNSGNGVLNGNVNVPGAIVDKNDGGTWLINSVGNIWSSTTITYGTLKLGANNALPIANLSLFTSGSGSAVFDMNGYNQTVTGLIAAAGGANLQRISDAVGTSVLTVSNAVDCTYAGVLLSGLTLNKVNTGKLTLSGTNTYAGSTVIGAGTLVVTSKGSISNSTSISIASGARFDVAGLTSTIALGASQTLVGKGGTLAGNLNMNLGALALNYASGTPALTVTNGTLAFNGNAVTVTVSGTALGAGVYKLIATTNSGVVAGTLPASVTISGLGTTAGAALQIIGGELYLVVGATSTALAASANPSGFHDGATLTAIVQTNGVTAGDATGTFAFYTNGVALTANAVAGGSAGFSLNALPRGTSLITAVYSGDANYLPSTNSLSQVVTNHLPVAVDMVCTRAKGVSLKIALASLLANVTDADGDPISLVSVGAGTNSATIMTDSSYVYYLPSTGASANDNDSLTYTVSDGMGGTATANIQVEVISATGLAQMSVPTDGVVNIKFFGVPNYTYVVQTTTNLATAWWNLSTNTAGNDGSWLFTDLNATNSQQYYRSAQP